MTPSLRVRLTVSLVGVLVAALAALSLVMHAVMARALVHQLDGRLDNDASAVGGMAEDDRAVVDFEYAPLPDFERAEDDRPAYFQLWTDDGKTVARSPSLGTRDLLALRPPEGAGHSDLALPDGRPGRLLVVRQRLRLEPGTTAALLPGIAPPPRESPRFVTVAVARGTEELREALASVRRWLVLLAGLTIAGASAVGVASVSRGLRSTRDVAATLARMDPARLGPPLPTAHLPAELSPVVAKLNELLARVEASLARERRFTADASHELRTPLAALRTTLEVAASRERSADEYRAAIAEADAVVRQMQTLCESLLALARLDAGATVVDAEAIALRELVDSCWRSLAVRADERGLTFANELPVSATAPAGADQLRVVVSNLLSNAVSYTAPGGRIRVRAGGARVVLEVDDSGPPIPAQVLPHIFERFVRGDAARSDGDLHCGIGLALARGLCAAMNLQVTARNTDEGGVSFSVIRA